MCSVCNGEGVVGGCPGCGSFKFESLVKESTNVTALPQVEIPDWYRGRGWDYSKAQNPKDTETTSKVKKFLNEIVLSSLSGSVPSKSFMILLPNDSGKRHAMFTMAANYLNNQITVAPIVDVATFNLLSSRNRVEDQALWLSLLQSKIVFVYETNFIVRRLSAKLFLDLCSTRALTGKPTIFFGSESHEELSRWGNVTLSLKQNQADIDHLATPLILDGVIRRDLM